MYKVMFYSVVGLLCSAAGAGDTGIRTGPWRAWLDSPGGELPFGMELERSGNELRAWILNGSERIEFTHAATLPNREVTFAISYYDSKITATINDDGTRLDGWWTKTAGKGQVTKMAFHAMAGGSPRFTPVAMRTNAALETIAGRWSVRFSKSDDPAVGVFEAGPDGTVQGTFLTTTGDYRFLAGLYERGRLLLSVFDGAHAFLFDARLQEDGTLQGDFWSRDVWHDRWTARRDSQARDPDGFNQVRTTRPRINFVDLTFRDLNGNTRTLADAEFAGAARIIEVFGTWCPNCHDATLLLNELYDRYHDRGLAIVAIAFELTGDFERDARQVGKYVKTHDVEYPILIAGKADKKKAAAMFPFLDGFKAYPTTIFADGDGEIVAVHSGFSGPATGDAHRLMVAKFRSLIEELIQRTENEQQ